MNNLSLEFLCIPPFCSGSLFVQSSLELGALVLQYDLRKIVGCKNLLVTSIFQLIRLILDSSSLLRSHYVLEEIRGNSLQYTPFSNQGVQTKQSVKLSEQDARQFIFEVDFKGLIKSTASGDQLPSKKTSSHS